MNQDGVVPNLVGGLGNQLFIASAAYSVGKHHTVPVYLCEATQNAHNIHNQDYRKSILAYLGKSIPGTTFEFRRNHPQYDVFPHADFTQWVPSLVRPPVILDGYYQCIDFLTPIENELRDRILLGLDEHILKVKELYKNVDFSKAAFLHVRRGDYLEKSNFHYLQSIDYYTEAYTTLFGKHTSKYPSTLFLFSDDVTWVSQTPQLMNLPNATIVTLSNELDCLALMSLCEAGAIVANSTFSWWGAYLGPYKYRSPISVPKKWIASKVYNLFPSEWKIL